MEISDSEFRKISYRVSSDLLDNAFDFLETGISLVAELSKFHKYMSESELKTSLFSVSTGVELILKAKIASLDWREVFDRPMLAEIACLRSGNFKSVSFDKCIMRIETLMQNDLSPILKKRIESVRHQRNRITHFHFKATVETTASLICYGIDAFIEFYRSYVRESFCEEKDRSKKLEEMLFQVEEYVTVRLDSVRPKLDHFNRPRTYHLSICNNCEQDTLILKDQKTVKCLFCDSENDIEEEAMLISEINKNEESVKACPRCQLKAMVTLSENLLKTDQARECINCGYFNDYPTRFSVDGRFVTSDSVRLNFSPIAIIWQNSKRPS